jgi:hypothetical protein
MSHPPHPPRLYNSNYTWRSRKDYVAEICYYNVIPVRYELGFYIPETGILDSHSRERLKSYTV